jgi:hypothetical protein
MTQRNLRLEVTSARRFSGAGDFLNKAAAVPTQPQRLSENMEAVVAPELDTIAQARTKERQLKRKKNPDNWKNCVAISG